MNIGQAKENIKNTVRLYLKKDEFGEYRIPVLRQRPVFLVGAPGIGKTAIMEQIAQELGIALVSYSMTHHTRQSALGLPVIRHMEFEGNEYDVSEYTMSEIISSVYDVMRESGLREGILFLDEINCVSETLAPSMLQFLQYKVFGRHHVPEGWVIVTAGNPREYNRSAREFDAVTLDRLKVIDVEADYEAWKAYAVSRGVHNAVINYLEIKKQDFYSIGTTEKGRAYVTARGWEDLSQILFLYEEEGLAVTQELIAQYIRHERIAREFAAYYDLYRKYKKDYHIEEILSGEASREMKERAACAPFDERISLLGMLNDRADAMMRECMEQSDYLTSLLQALRAVKAAVQKDRPAQSEQSSQSEKPTQSEEQAQSEKPAQDKQPSQSEKPTQDKQPAQDGRTEIVSDSMEKQACAREKLLDSLAAANALSAEDKRMHRRVIRFLEEQKKSLMLSDARNAEERFLLVKAAFDEETAKSRRETERTKDCIRHLFAFVEEAFAGGNEMLLLVTHMTVTDCCAGFIARFGCEEYQKRSGEMMLSERRNALLQEIGELGL